MTTQWLETEALVRAMEDSEADSDAYVVDEYLRENFLPGELRSLEHAANLLADRARWVRTNDPDYDPSKVA